MLKLSTFILILVITLVEVKAASVCENVPLVKAVDLRREMSPIKDQDSIGWCYGFTAADLLTHYLYKTKGQNIQGNVGFTDYRLKSFNVSSMAISTMYNQKQKSDYSKALNNKTLLELQKTKTKVVAEGGTVLGALLVAKENGFCFEKDVSSEDFSYVEDYRCAVKNRCKIAEILNIVYSGPKENIGCDDLFTIQNVFPSLKLGTIKSILTRSARQNALSNLVNLSCKKRFTNNFGANHPKIESKTIKIGESSTELMDSLDNHLNRRIPVGIMYYADFLMGGTGKQSAHASSIVGKAFNPAICEVEYILKNSWGRGCGYYQKENPGLKKCTNDLKELVNSKKYFEKLTVCKNQFKPIPRNPRVRCEEPSGYVFVRKSDLKNQIYDVTAIQEDRLF